ncbi:hypothetical protein FRC12_000704 [Ceratobasidium sp. 428]|nr:hypothetical protein FRC12_000704 [Ceratobasidium sp. 428]
MPYNVTIDDISPLITYQGRWKDSFNLTNSDPYTDQYLGSSFHVSITSGAQFLFQFNGIAVYIFGAKRTNHGNYSVQLDNEKFKEFNGLAPVGLDRVFQVPIYAREGLPNRLHKVVLTNKGGSTSPYVDIDFVTWTSNDEPNRNETFGNEKFSYSDGWINTSPDVAEYHGRTGHTTSQKGASASLTFEGTGIYLYGGTSPDHGAYTIELDDNPLVLMNGSTKDYHPKILLFYADSLGPGVHKITAINADTEGKFLDIDYADIVQTSLENSATPIFDTKNSTSGIVGAVCGTIIVLALVTAIAWYLMRRKKHLSESADLINEEYGPSFDTPPTGYGPSGGGPGWIDILPTTGATNFEASGPRRNMKTCRPAVQIAGTMNQRTAGGRVVTSRGIISQTQDCSTSSDASETEATDMPPPEYLQTTESPVPPR